VPHQCNLVLVPWRVPQRELDEVAPLHDRLLVAEHLERVLAVVLPEPARPHAAERERVDRVLQTATRAECILDMNFSARTDGKKKCAYLHQCVVEDDGPRRRLLHDPAPQRGVAGERVDSERLRYGSHKGDAVLDPLQL
jgi:hypothetical protein